MNSYLLYPDKSSTGEAAYPSFQDIYKDLNLNIILKTMAQNDGFLMEQIRHVMMIPITRPTDIAYRYDIIRDFGEEKELLEEMFRLGEEGFKLAGEFKNEKEQNRNKTAARTSNIIHSLNFLTSAFGLIIQLRDCMENQANKLHSDGLRHLWERLKRYPLDEFLMFHKKLLFYTTGGEGVFSVQISGGLKLEQSRLLECSNYPTTNLKGTPLKLMKLYYKVARKDTLYVENETLEKDIRLFIEKNIQQVVEEYQPLIHNCQTFLFDFAKEISFYKGVNQLQMRVKEFPLPLCYGGVSDEKGTKEIDDLYDLSLGLYMQKMPIPNALHNEKKSLTVITGANQGGKSTFLRSFGIAQIMMQCGMPVPATHFTSGLYPQIYTHFTRKEDAMLSRGRLEEELKRMSQIISQLTKDSLLLLNESFASTTEKEGSQIAENIIGPLYKKEIEIIMVTHLHEFARQLYKKNHSGCEFLVAERKENGDRTYRMLHGKPHYSSYGTDLYEYMIGEQSLK